MFTSLTTPRLRLRRLTAADLPALYAYRNDPQVARYQTWTALTEAALAGLIRDQGRIAPGTRGEWSQIGVALLETDALIGDVALHVVGADGRQAEIGYTLARSAWGRGYAAEAVARLLDFCFGDLALHRVTALADARNAASIRLLERLGFRREAHFVESFWDRDVWADEVLYALLDREWAPG